MCNQWHLAHYFVSFQKEKRIYEQEVQKTQSLSDSLKLKLAIIRLGNAFGTTLWNHVKGISHFAIPWKSECMAHNNSVLSLQPRAWSEAETDQTAQHRQPVTAAGLITFNVDFCLWLFNSTCPSPGKKPPGLMGVGKDKPGIADNLYICKLTLVCFWGLRRVKYAWLQHGWLQVFSKTTKQMTWNLYLAETNRILDWFFFFFRERGLRVSSSS